MNKISTFFIVVILIARGVIYIYDHNKTKIDNLVSQSDPGYTKNTVRTDRPGSAAGENQEETVSVFAITFLLSGNNEIYYYAGEFNGELNMIDYSSIGIFIKTYKSAVPPEELMFIIKADKNATPRNVTDVLDEMVKNEVPAGHYAEREIGKEEMDRIKLLKQTKNG